MPSSDYLIWIDLEMTGLKPDIDVIIEMATIVTDANLNVVCEGPVIAIISLMVWTPWMTGKAHTWRLRA
jgi:oligoribonuclease (3'-5' exoribonuclease)